METPFSVPASISFRQLQAYAQTAPVEPCSQLNSVDAQAAALEAALEAWSRSSQELLQRLQQNGPALAQGRSPRQVMALGALQAHVAMGMQALAHSRRHQG